jgi:hypothetical protein
MWRSVEHGNSSPFPTLPVMDCVHKEYDRTRAFSRSGREAKGFLGLDLTTWRAHQVPVADLDTKPEHLPILEDWLKSYVEPLEFRLFAGHNHVCLCSAPIREA